MFGLSWIKLAIIGVIIALIATYIGVLKLEVHHYKGELESVKVAFEAYKIKEEGMQSALKSRADALTLQAKESLIAQWKAEEGKAQAIKERVANDKAAKALVVARSTISVLNDSTAPSGGNTQGATDTKQGDVSGAGTPEADYTLQDVESAFTDNAANQWKCVEQVKEWQRFWKDFAEGVRNVEKSSGS